MKLQFSVETALSTSVRARQVGAMFDAPAEEKCTLHYDIDLPIDDGTDWNVGLVVGPSGSGKSTVLRHAWGEMPELQWVGASVVDDFASSLTMDQVAAACGAVGFNTIPAWMRPFSVLSTGERFRVDIARRLLELPDPIVVDEYTSVIDRQVAQIGSHAIQKFVRRQGRKFVAVGCHRDVIDWLQPDWVLDMATRSFTRRVLQRRPSLDVVVGRLPYAAWDLFAPFHYLSATLHQGARCFGLWVNGRLAAFAGMMHTVHPSKKAQNIMRCSRLVTLPDFQGLGLAHVLIEQVGAAYAGVGKRTHTFPAHPGLVRSFDKSERWSMCKEAGFGAMPGDKSTLKDAPGKRPCAVFEYIGAAMPRKEAERLLGVG